MDPNSKASIPNNGNPAKLIKQKVPPLVIKKNRLLSNHDDSNSPTPNSDDEFRSPRKIVRARNLSPASSSFFPTQNRFSPLEIENSNQVNPPTNLTNNSGPENNSQGTQAKPKIPPIYVHNISDYVKFHDSLDNITIDDYSITNTKSALKLNLCSVDDYRATTNYLDESKIDYHTFQLPENKQLSIIIRNLPVNTTEQCIFNELIEQKFEVTSVTRLQNKFKNPLPIVAVLLSKPSIGIYSLTRLLHCVVVVEPRRPSKDIPQCTNCQRFAHTKKFCHLPPRCVKCAGDHHYSLCQKSNDTPPKCVNCNSNHPASYRGCTYYKDISKNKNKKNDSKNTSRLPRSNFQAEQSPPVYTSNKPQDNAFADKRSYASATKNKLNNHPNKNTDNDFMNSLLPLINAFVSQLLQK
ncbi:Uncharacterized protein FWK35_00039261 [Aphis craccivora]|uniref:Pre-C2HC domain-containing protein n=1 Tax=Aphis craccivora TaxID=307492 RepID=A0A6G0VS08_APHCR|nr:Uncharacterized protein FWK35_00039261 [Aphis craccivora]